MVKYNNKKKYKKNKKRVSTLAKRVKKLENLTKETVNRSYWYNAETHNETINDGIIVQDPFSLGLISVKDDSSTLPNEVAYGERVGPSIMITNMNIKIKMRFSNPLALCKWQRIRVIMFRIPPTYTTQANSQQPFPIPSDILELTVGVNHVGKTNAYYAKNSKLTYKIIKDRTFMLHQPYGVVNTPPSYSSIGVGSNYRICEFNFKFPKGKTIEYDENGNPKNGLYRLLLISENDTSDVAHEQECPSVSFMTRVNYIQ
jgi:hypothetical protein